MILSNRKLKLIIISLLLLIFCWFIGLFNVHALNVTDFTLLETISGNGCTRRFNFQNNSNSFEENLALYDNSTCYLTNTNYDKDYLIIPVNVFYQIETQLVQVVDNSVVFLLQTDVGNIYCDFENGIATCPFKISGASTITQIRVLITKSSSSGTLHVRVTSGWYSGTTASQSIGNIQNNTSDIKDSINNSNIDSNQASSSSSEWSSKNASNGTITQLLTLPIALLNKFYLGIGGTCNSFTLGNLLGTTLTLPCINLRTLIGDVLWNTIDILFSGFMIFAIAKKLIKIFNDFTNLKSNQIDELYGGGK